MGALGDLLREAREGKGFSFSNVEELTKIRKKHLRALENGAYAELPPQVYVRGFLRSLATYLDLDADDLLRLYNEETLGQEPAPRPVRLTSEPLVPAPLRIANWLAGAGILTIIGILAYWTYQQRLWEQVLPLIAPPTRLTVTLSTATPTRQIVLLLTPVATETPVDRPTATATAVPSRPSPSPTAPQATDSPLATETPSPTQAATDTPEPTATPRPPTFTATRSASPTAFPQLLLIRLEISERTWVRVLIDEEEVFQGILEEGAFRTWVARREATIRTGNAGGTWLRINEGPREAMGERGQVIQNTWQLQADGIVVTATPAVMPTPTATTTS